MLIDLECCAHKPGERTRTETERVERQAQPAANASESINPTPLSFLPSSPSPLHPPPQSPLQIFHERFHRRSRLIVLCQPCISGGHGYRHSSGNLLLNPSLFLYSCQQMSQSQLANVIYYPSQGQPGAHCVTRRNSYAQPCNPPTPTSATANFHWDWDEAARYRAQNATPYVTPAPLRSCDTDAEMEDEQAVEELLNAHTPNHAVAPPHRQQLSKFRPITAQQQQQQQQQQQFSTALSSLPPLGSPTLYDATPAQSAFVNTDPFYLAAVQSSSSSSSLAPTAPPSFFAQAARPAPNSPFNLNLSGQQSHHALELESRTVLVGAGQSR